MAPHGKIIAVLTCSYFPSLIVDYQNMYSFSMKLLETREALGEKNMIGNAYYTLIYLQISFVSISYTDLYVLVVFMR